METVLLFEPVSSFELEFSIDVSRKNLKRQLALNDIYIYELIAK